MGGIGSGRTSWGGPPKVEQHRSVDLSWLRRHGMLKPGKASSITWSRDGRTTGITGVIAHEDAVELIGFARDHEGKLKPVSQWVSLVETDTQFGGRRKWFCCPGCGRRCRVLYGGSRYLCRQCRGLVYASQFEQPQYRSLRRAQSIRRRLGGSGDITDPFPAKPKHMHWSTYARLQDLDEELQDSWAAGMMVWIRESFPRHSKAL